VGSEEVKSFIRVTKNVLQRKFVKCREKDVDERQRTSMAKSEELLRVLKRNCLLKNGEDVRRWFAG
jgi:hypothetical protein